MPRSPREAVRLHQLAFAAHARRLRRARPRRRVRVARARRGAHVDARHDRRSCSTRRARATTGTYKEYAQLIDEQSERLITLRGLFRTSSRPRPRCRSRRSSRRRRSSSASRPARCRSAPSRTRRTRTLAIAMNRIGGKSNTGEGGEDPVRYTPLAERRLDALGDQAGRLGPLRRHRRLPGQRRRAADQDGAGRQARRGRSASRPQGLEVHRASCATPRRAWA